MLKSGWSWDKEKSAFFYFILKKEVLPEQEQVIGPFVRQKLHVKKFMKKHKKTVIKKKRIFAVEKRKFRVAEDLIKDTIKSTYVKEKISSIKIR